MKTLTQASFSMRQAEAEDLNRVNEIVKECVMSWNLPERVKRLSLQSYYYHLNDLNFLKIYICQSFDTKIIGVVAIEDHAEEHHGAINEGDLLHGIYVSPSSQRLGVGRLMMNFIVRELGRINSPGLLVKAQQDAIPFFEKLGLRQLQPLNHEKDYEHSFWCPASDFIHLNVLNS